LVNRLTDSAKRLQPLLATVTLVEESSDRLFDQVIGASIQTAREFFLHLSG